LGTIVTTTLIYEPIAYISDDYFRTPKANRPVSNHDNTDGQKLIETRTLVLNVTDGNAVSLTASLPETDSN
jgi:hypothetical protein